MNAEPIGIVVVGHGELSTALVQAACTIVKDHGPIRAVAIDSNAPSAENAAVIGDAISAVRGAAGVLVLTDIFGGTPSNLCLPYLDNAQCAIVCGVNLPILIKALSEAGTQSLEALVPFLHDYGKRTVVIAENVLRGDI